MGSIETRLGNTETIENANIKSRSGGRFGSDSRSWREDIDAAVKKASKAGAI